jgi:hypothetical protein
MCPTTSEVSVPGASLVLVLEHLRRKPDGVLAFDLSLSRVSTAFGATEMLCYPADVLAFPIFDGIPCLDSDNGVLAARLKI